MLSAVVTAGSLAFRTAARDREARELRWRNHLMGLELVRNAVVRSAPQANVESREVPMNAAAPSISVRTPIANPYRGEGNASPLAALQTIAWAGDSGDVAIMVRLLRIDAGARSKLEMYWVGLPEQIRKQWLHFDVMAAELYTRSVMQRPFPDADLLATASVEEIAAAHVRVRLPGVPRDGMEFQRGSNGWQLVITEAMVDDYLDWVRRESSN